MVLLKLRLKLLSLDIMDSKNKTIKIVLEIIKAVAGMLIGYFGGNAVM